MSAGSRYEYDFDPEARNRTAASIFRLAREGGARVLDLGSGPGIVAGALADLPETEVTCLDVRPDHLEAAAARGVHHTVQADLSTPHWTDELTGSYDVVILADVLEHLVEPGRLLDTIREHSLLADGGYLVVSIPNVAHEAVLACLAANDFPYQPTGLLDRTHLRFFTRTSFTALAEEHGFTVSRIHRTTRRLEQTEFAWLAGRVDQEALAALRDDDPDHLTYQYVMRVEPLGDPAALRPVRAEQDEAGCRRADDRDRLETELQEREDFIHQLGDDLSALRTELADAQEQISELRAQRQRLADKLEAVYASETWRAGAALLALPKAIRRWLR